MAIKIHPTAIVHPKAELGEGVEVGPFSRIEQHVVIGEGTRIGSSCVIEGWTTIGKKNTIFTGAVIGSIPQDLKYKGKKSYLIIGDHNTIREYVTMNPGTEEGTKTIVGSGNEFMAYVHIAHDCVLGNNIIMANLGGLSGHVEIADRVIIGGMAGIHQFVKIGQYAIVGGLSKIVQDVPPYSIVDGNPAQLKGMNNVGLLRAQFSVDVRLSIKKAIRILMKRDMSLPHAVSLIETEVASRTEEVQQLLAFLTSTKRGITR